VKVLISSQCVCVVPSTMIRSFVRLKIANKRFLGSNPKIQME